VALAAMERLRLRGVRFAIDDFGTGYSSLAQLKRLPVTELKIDRSFVLGLEAGGDDEVIVKSTIELGHALGLKVVAEGVEHAVIMTTLGRLGCDQLQGYGVARPMRAADFFDWAQARMTAAAQGATGT
jgi:EAL domain-containing protein (putative c-di-GMP-specific phosphodiesterase class I)